MEHQRIAYVIIPLAKPGQRIAFVTFREEGYTPTVYDDARFTEAECERIVTELNQQIGVTSSVALSMLAGSMFGWHVPGAQESHRALQPSRMTSSTAGAVRPQLTRVHKEDSPC